MAGYVASRDLSQLLIVEPSAGSGSFLLCIVERLAESCRRYGRPIESCKDAISAYELDDVSASGSRASIVTVLGNLGVKPGPAAELAASWVRTGDYLLDRPALPNADMVVGNPPYVRLEEIDPRVLATYRRRYPTMVGRADLYVGFFEAALRQLKSEGVCVFICADRWMLNQYGARLRDFVTAQFSVDSVLEMHTVDAFLDDVDAYPAITRISRRPQQDTVVGTAMSGLEVVDAQVIHQAIVTGQPLREVSDTKTVLKIAKVPVWFEGEAPWPYSSPERLALLRRLEEQFYPLQSAGSGTRVSIGVATGADDLFITEDEDLVESDRLLPLAMARDLVTGEVVWSGKYLVNPWNGRALVDLTRYPQLASYFQEHRERLKSRHVGQKNDISWYRTIDKVDECLTTRSKLYIADIKDRLRPVLDRGQTYPHHNLYFIESRTWDPEVLGGILLSDVAQFFIESYAIRMRGGYLRFQAQYLRRIRTPLPHEIAEADRLALKVAFRDRDVKAANLTAFRLYGVDEIPSLEDA